MEFRRQEEGNYTAPPRESAFTRPTLTSFSPPPTSLLSPRAPLTPRNGLLLTTKDPDPSPPPPSPPTTTTTILLTAPRPTTLTIPTPPDPDTASHYHECLRNHAASHGGHVLDGCGEFMSGTALTCAACGCHRSFHRKEPTPDHHSPSFYHHGRVPLLLPAPHHHHHKQFYGAFQASPTGIAPSGGTTESSSEEMNANMTTAMPPSTKKRFRTKFTSDQKEKMMEFAKRVEWRIQKQDEVEMERFCGEIGVSRQVMKVWMHNNKHSSIKKPQVLDHDGQQKQESLNDGMSARD